MSCRISAGWFEGLRGTITLGPRWCENVKMKCVNVALDPSELDARMGQRVPWILDAYGRVEMTFAASYVERAP